LHFGPDGHLYVDSYDTGQLLRYDESTFAELPSPGRTGANFIDADTSHYVNGFGWGPDGNLYVAKVDFHYSNGFVDEYDGVTGDYLATFIPPDPTTIVNIDGIVWEDGNLYITNKAGPSTTGVLEYDAAGNFVRVFASDPSLGNPVGLVFCDPGMAARASQPPIGGKGVVVVWLASPLNQPDARALVASTTAPTEDISGRTESRPQESLAAPAASVTQGIAKPVGHQAPGDSAYAGLDHAASLAGRLSAAELDLLASE
jgi:hypothetical protein